MKVCIECSTKFKSEDWECPSCHKRPQVIHGNFAFAPLLAEHSNGFKDEYFEQLANLEDRNYWFRSRSRIIIWSLSRYFPNAENFFELGCGTGYVLSCIEQELRGLKLYGGEISPTALGFASKRLSRAELFQIDARKIPFNDEFDIIAAFDALEHIEDDEMVLQQMHQAVRPNGGIILTVPHHPFLWSRTDDYASHVRRYTTHDLKTKVEKIGFEVLKITSFVSIIFPLMLISRFKKKRSSLEFDPMSEIQVKSFLNYILEKALNLELSIIRLGISFPIGGSLLLVARKSSE